MSSVHAILSKIEPKVTRVDPKNTEKRPIYDIKLFCVTKCDRESIIYRFYIEIRIIFFIFQVLRTLTQRCYGHKTLGLCRPLGELFALDKIYLTRNVQKWTRKKIVKICFPESGISDPDFPGFTIYEFRIFWIFESLAHMDCF